METTGTPVLTVYSNPDAANASLSTHLLAAFNVTWTNVTSLEHRLPSPSLEPLPLPLLVLVFCLQLVVVISALLGNGVVLTAIALCRHLRGNHARYIASLAVADFGVAATAMPFALYRTWTQNVWGLGVSWCRLYVSLDLFFSAASLLMLTVMTFDRYLAICHPMTHQTMPWQAVAAMITCCWLVPPFLSFVPIMSGWHQRGGRFTSQRVPSCSPLANEAFAASSMTLTVIFPAAIIFALNVRMYLVARRQSSVILSVGGGMRHWGRSARKKLESSNSCPNLTSQGLEFPCKVVEEGQGQTKPNQQDGEEATAQTGSADREDPDPDQTVAEAFISDRSPLSGDKADASYTTVHGQRVLEIESLIPSEPTGPRSRQECDGEKAVLGRFVRRDRHALSQKHLNWDSSIVGHSSTSRNALFVHKLFKSQSFSKLRKNSSDPHLVERSKKRVKTCLSSMKSDAELRCDAKSHISSRSNENKGGQSSPLVRKKGSNSSLTGKTRAARTVGLLTGVFLVCWLPCWVVEIVAVARGTRVSAAAYQVTLWLAYLNSSLNPLLYCLTSNSLTAAVRALLRRRPTPPVVICESVFKDSTRLHGAHV